jgi:hypothetical protein
MPKARGGNPAVGEIDRLDDPMRAHTSPPYNPLTTRRSPQRLADDDDLLREEHDYRWFVTLADAGELEVEGLRPARDGAGGRIRADHGALRALRLRAAARHAAPR